MLFVCRRTAATPAQRFLCTELARYSSRRNTAHAAEPVDSSDSEGEGRLLTVSLTIVIPNQDIPLVLYDTVSTYLTVHTKAGSVSTERGGAFKHLHIQGVYQRRGTSTQRLKRLI